MPLLRRLLMMVFVTPLVAGASEPQPLTAGSFAELGDQRGVVLLGINWNRMWDCGQFENAQLHRLSFRAVGESNAAATGSTLDFEIPQRLLRNDYFTDYELLLEPGEYALSGFDIKVAESVSRVRHLVQDSEHLFSGSEPLGGTFSVSTGELVYIGHFELDCAEAPIPWRYYIDDPERFNIFIAGLRKKYPFLADTPAHFRLFSTTRFGFQFSLAGGKDQ